MSSESTISARNMDRKRFEPNAEIEQYLESLSTTELRELASYARKKAAGREDPARKPGGQGGRWLEAQYVNGSGPYFRLRFYEPGTSTYRDERDHLVSGKLRSKYVGRHMPAELAEEFGYPEGATPEETSIHISGTPRHGSSRKKKSSE